MMSVSMSYAKDYVLSRLLYSQLVYLYPIVAVCQVLQLSNKETNQAPMCRKRKLDHHLTRTVTVGAAGKNTLPSPVPH
jgi:hypothetical protein